MSLRLPAPERREQILDVSVQVFAQRGFHSTSMNDVADAVGVTKARLPVLPDVPTIGESGFPHLESDTWYALFAPQGTPPEIAESVAATVREALKDSELRKSFATLGGVPLGNSPAEFSAMVREESDRWMDLVRRYPVQ